MRIFSTLTLVTPLVCTSTVQAGVVVGGTRLIYDSNKKESSLSVSNPDKIPYLIQSWVENASGGNEKTPFIVTPPLFRLDGGQENVLRVVRAGGNLSSDKESMYWMNIKSIPSVTESANHNTLQISVKTRIKLIYRPSEVKGTPEDVADKLSWRREGNILKVTNPTPFYMNFQEVKVGGGDVRGVTYVAPKTSTTFSIPSEMRGKNINWKIISDYGGISKEYSGSL